jgi:hypothetical protein
LAGEDKGLDEGDSRGKERREWILDQLEVKLIGLLMRQKSLSGVSMRGI